MDTTTWRAKATKDNRGRAPEQLAYKPEPGIEVGPLAFEAPPSSRAREPRSAWTTLRTHVNADGLAEDVASGSHIRIDRRAVTTPRDLAALLDGVDLQATRWGFAHGDLGSAAAFIALWKGLGLEGAPAVDFGLDPIGKLAQQGFLLGSVDDNLRAGAEFAQWLPWPDTTVFTADGTIWHHAGADQSLALALTLSSVVAYARAMDSLRVDVRLAVGGRFLLGISTLRAARRTLDRVADLCGSSVRLSITAVPAAREHTTRDPWVNMLRGTTSAFGGIVGGADRIELVPYAEAPGAQRLARNTAHVLRDEAHLGRVLDPAAGSWAIEQLTDQLARRAWERFQDIERAGGLLACVRSGWVASEIQSCRDRLSKRTRTRTDGIVGISRFANLDESRVLQPEAPEVGTAYTEGDEQVESFAELIPHALRLPLSSLQELRVPSAGQAERCDPCTAWNRAEDFEILRNQERSAFIATLGPLAKHTARTAFGAELLAAGGIRTTSGGEDIESALSAWRKSDTRLVVVSAVDHPHTADLVRRLVQAGATVWTLGPDDFPTASGKLHRGVDVLASLREMRDAR